MTKEEFYWSKDIVAIELSVSRANAEYLDCDTLAAIAILGANASQ
ncbi:MULTISPECIES: hypothetical protein [Nostoc]|nr:MULTISPECIES: hypothetical protein [Nostoc]